MGIRTLSTETNGDRTITQVEVTYELPGRGQNYTAWEFACDACDVMHTGLHEVDARNEFTNHVCEERVHTIDAHTGEPRHDVLRTKSGRVLTELDIERFAAEAEETVEGLRRPDPR